MSFVRFDPVLAVELEWEQSFVPHYGYSVLPTSDGGYLLGGQRADLKNDPTGSYWTNKTALLIKVDSSGSVEWTKTYDETVGGGASAMSVFQNDDSGYVVVGLQLKSYNQVVFLLAVDLNGNVQWNTTIAWDDYVESCEAIKTRDGGYLIIGVNGRKGSDKLSWILKTDEKGNSLWDKTFGHSYNGLYAVTECDDGGYVMAGHLERDCLFIKIDVYGNLQWNQTYDFHYPDEVYNTHTATCVAKTLDGGYILAGKTSDRSFVAKTNSNGELEWNHFYENFTLLNSIVQISERESYIAVGGLNAPTITNRGIWVVQLDNLGNLLWNATFRLFDDTYSHNFAYSIIKTNEDGYVITGTLEDNVWLAKFLSDSDVPVFSVLSIIVAALFVLVGVFLVICLKKFR